MEQHTIKTYWKMKVWLHANINSTTVNWLASRPGRFIPSGIAYSIHWIGGWVGPRIYMITVLKRKKLCPRRESSSP